MPGKCQYFYSTAGGLHCNPMSFSIKDSLPSPLTPSSDLLPVQPWLLSAGITFSTFSSSHNILFLVSSVKNRFWVLDSAAQQLRACSSSPQRSTDGATPRCLKFHFQGRSCSAGTCSWTCNCQRMPLAKICL